MKITNYKKEFFKDDGGAVAVIAAIVLFFVLIGIAALAIDIGRISTTKNELQNIADAAALGGTVQLREIYIDPEKDAHNCNLNSDCRNEIINAVNQIARENMAGGISNIDIDEDDIEIGQWISPNSFITYSDNPNLIPNAVKVTARRTDENAVTLYFARIFNMVASNISSNAAIAALTGASKMPEPEVTTPFAISELKFNYDCEGPIQFRPSASCGAWHNFYWGSNSDDINTHALSTIYRHKYKGSNKSDNDQPLLDGKEWLEANFNIHKLEEDMEKLYKVGDVADIDLPPYKVGTEFEFIGGVSSTHFNTHYLSPDLNEGDSYYDGNETTDGAISRNSGNVANNPNNPAPIFALFDYFRYRDGDGDNKVWSTYVPVYEEEGTGVGDCNNPNQSKKIVGFAKAEVTMPVGPPDSEIEVNLECTYEFVDDEGSEYTGGNVAGTVPRLVQ